MVVKTSSERSAFTSSGITPYFCGPRVVRIAACRDPGRIAFPDRVEDHGGQPLEVILVNTLRVRGAFRYRGQVAGTGGRQAKAWPWWRGCCCVQPRSTSLLFLSQSLHIPLVLARSRILLVRSDGQSSSRMGWKVSRAATIDNVGLSIPTQLPFGDTSSSEGLVETLGVTSVAEH